MQQITMHVHSLINLRDSVADNQVKERFTRRREREPKYMALCVIMMMLQCGQKRKESVSTRHCLQAVLLLLCLLVA